MIRVLVETGFLIALNPRDRNHSWAMGILEDARRRKLELNVSPVAPLELSLILRSRGLSEGDQTRVLEALDSAIRMWVRPKFPSLDLQTFSLSSRLRQKYPQLTFFDSIHAAVALSRDLTYYDLDEEIRKVCLESRELP